MLVHGALHRNDIGHPMSTTWLLGEDFFWALLDSASLFDKLCSLFDKISSFTLLFHRIAHSLHELSLSDENFREGRDLHSSANSGSCFQRQKRIGKTNSVSEEGLQN